MSDASAATPALRGLARAAALWPGVLACALIAVSATFVSEHYGGPPLLYALLMGLAMNFLSSTPATTMGIGFCSSTLVRAGVALLGVRITVAQVSGLGWATAFTIVGAVTATVLAGWLLARILGCSREEGLLTGASVGICGASAALAVAAVLPQTRENQRFTLMTVVGVTLLSTVAMVLYPLVLKLFAVGPVPSGVFLGGTIHDVAQVVAAGSLLGANIAETAVVVKLLRVAMLAPAVICIGLLVRHRATPTSGKAVALLPAFMVAFVALMLAGSVGAIPSLAVEAASSTSRWFLVAGIAAAGMKTDLQEILRLGWRPFALLALETIFLALFVGCSLYAAI